MKFTPVRLAQSELAQLPVVDGQLIFAFDTGNVYIDTAYGRFQQGISMLSDSSEVPLAPADKLYFNKQTKELLYNGQSITASQGMQKVAVQSDAAAQVGKWYLCFNDLTVTLPSQHSDKDSIKVSTVMDVKNVTVRPAAGDTIQSDSGFLLNILNSSVQLTWLNGNWVASQVIIPKERAPFAVVDGLPFVGQEKVYYNTLNNKLYYWDGAWRGVADFQDRVTALQNSSFEHAYGVKLGKCTDLGVIYGSDSIQLTWKDPQNVYLDTAVLAEWNQTRLLKKKGSYPSDQSDSEAEVVAVTSRQLGNKNHYHNNPIHQSSSDSTYYKLFSQAMSGDWNSLTANCYPLASAMSWGMVQGFVRAGRGPDLFPVGTVFEVDHSEYTANGHGIYFRVSGHDQVPAADESLTHTMCLEMVDTLFSNGYDENETTYAMTADTTAQAGKSYYAYDGSSFTLLIDGTDYDVGDPVPAASWYEKNLDERNIGSNNAAQSNLIQWANSDGAANLWFTPQTLWDQCSAALQAKSGFMRYLDSQFAEVVQPAKLITARCTAEGGGSITHSAKFWALSMTQITGELIDGIMENTRLQYYADGGSMVKKIFGTDTVSSWWMRSPNTFYANYVRYISTSGTTSNTYARNGNGYSLACIIA